jgi:hypothetical protein
MTAELADIGVFENRCDVCRNPDDSAAVAE